MAGTPPEEVKVRYPALRDVLRHLVHHAPDLSSEMRDQFHAAIDDVFPARDEPGPDPELGPELPPPPG